MDLRLDLRLGLRLDLRLSVDIPTGDDELLALTRRGDVARRLNCLPLLKSRIEQLLSDDESIDQSCTLPAKSLY